MGIKFGKRRGIGNVITTLIVLIASVVLAAGLVFFGGSIFEASAKVEAIQVSNSHVWVSASGSSVAGFVVQNIGDAPVSLQKISLRGQAVPVSSWYYNNSASVATQDNIMTELRYDSSPGSVNVGGSSAEELFTQANGAITLQQGQAMFVYLDNPANLSMLDAGFDMSLNVQAEKVGSVQKIHAVAV